MSEHVDVDVVVVVDVVIVVVDDAIIILITNCSLPPDLTAVPNTLTTSGERCAPTYWDNRGEAPPTSYHTEMALLLLFF